MKACFVGVRKKALVSKSVDSIKELSDCELFITKEALQATDPVVGLEFMRQCATRNIKITVQKSLDEQLKADGIHLQTAPTTPPELKELLKSVILGADVLNYGAYTASELGNMFELTKELFDDETKEEEE
jgi:hypothetical protein